MIVNPQLFNYRLIIGSLIVAVTILGVFSYTNYKSITAHQDFLEQEVKLVESELSQMIAQYDEISVSNALISSELESARKDTKLALDSLSMLKSDLSVLAKYKNQLVVLRSRNQTLFNAVDSLDQMNEDLKKKNSFVSNQLSQQKIANKHLIEQNETLNRTLEEAAYLTANSFEANSFTYFLGKKSATDNAKKVEKIEVCFTLAENTLTEEGEKELYIQIVNPQNNVMADKGAINFGNSSLIYSTKKIVNYSNKVLDICVDVEADAEEKPLTEGTYFINVFNDDRKLGSTEVTLN
ncbi:MAG: hypothetical protein HRU26_11365 [Psychroserpens sp.]|nr:hypothetical protein [Psychroserpens sp.]